MTDILRPIIGIENRTAQEVFDIMCDRFRISHSLPSNLPEYGHWFPDLWDAYLADLVGWQDRRNWAQLPATFRWHEFYERICAALTPSATMEGVMRAAAISSSEHRYDASALSGDAFGLTDDEAWEQLVNFDDRTSPAEYPDMALITREELSHFMRSSAVCELGDILSGDEGDAQ